MLCQVNKPQANLLRSRRLTIMEAGRYSSVNKRDKFYCTLKSNVDINPIAYIKDLSKDFEVNVPV